MKTRYVDILLENQKFLQNMSTRQVKLVKAILEEIKTEEMLKRYLEGGDIIEDNAAKFDIKEILIKKNCEYGFYYYSDY